MASIGRKNNVPKSKVPQANARPQQTGRNLNASLRDGPNKLQQMPSRLPRSTGARKIPIPQSNDTSREPPSWLKEITKEPVRGINPERLRMMQERDDGPELNMPSEQKSFIESHFPGSGANASFRPNSRVPNPAEKNEQNEPMSEFDRLKLEKLKRILERKKTKEKINSMFLSAMSTRHKIEAELRLAKKNHAQNELLPYIVNNQGPPNQEAGGENPNKKEIFPVYDRTTKIVHSLLGKNLTKLKKTTQFARKAIVGAILGGGSEPFYDLSIEINDNENRHLLSSAAFITQLSNSTPGYCYISVMGKYYPNKSLSVEEGELPLYLHVHCKDKLVLEQVNKAILELMQEDTEQLKNKIERRKKQWMLKEERLKFILKQQALENMKWIAQNKQRKEKFKKYQEMTLEERVASVKKKYDEEDEKSLKIEIPLTKSQMDYDKHFNFKKRFYGFKGENIEYILKKQKLTDSEVKIRLKGAGFNINKVTLEKDLTFPLHAIVFDRTGSIESEILQKIVQNVEELVTTLSLEFVDGRKEFESKKNAKKQLKTEKKKERQLKNTAVKEEDVEEISNGDEEDEEDDEVIIDELFVPDVAEKSKLVKEEPE